MIKIKIIPISWDDAISITLIEGKAGFDGNHPKYNYPDFLNSGRQIISAMEGNHCILLLQSIILACLEQIKKEEKEYGDVGHWYETKMKILNYLNDK